MSVYRATPVSLLGFVFLGVMNGISELKKTESFLRMDAVDGPGAFNFVDCIISFDTLGSVSAFSVV